MAEDNNYVFETFVLTDGTLLTTHLTDEGVRYYCDWDTWASCDCFHLVILGFLTFFIYLFSFCYKYRQNWTPMPEDWEGHVLDEENDDAVRGPLSVVIGYFLSLGESS